MKIYTALIESPLGLLNLAATDNGLCLLEFDSEDRIQHHWKQFENSWGEFHLEHQTNEWIHLATEQLHEYFSKARTSFEIPLDLVGSEFQKSVWNELLKIPYGSTRSYKDQALAVGNLKAIRAVATANGENRISIIIPCHRVIGSDGSLTGYGGELWRKKALLEHESQQTQLFQ